MTIPQVCSSSVPSSSGEAGQEVSLSEREVDALTSKIGQLTLAAQETSAPCINLRSLQTFQQNEFFKPQTPLTWAVSHKKKDFVAWMLDNGARADEPDDTNKTPLSYAAELEDVDIMELLVKHGALPDSEQMRPNIYLVTKPDTSTSFRATIEALLKEGENTQVGKRLLEKIGKAPHPIFITNHELESYCKGNSDGHIPGKGGSSLIYYCEQETSYLSIDGSSATHPKCAGLFHELIHAYHNSKGKNAAHGTECDKMVWSCDEEFKTIMGFPSKNPERKTPKITENHILAELHKPERISYMAPKAEAKAVGI